MTALDLTSGEPKRESNPIHPSKNSAYLRLMPAVITAIRIGGSLLCFLEVTFERKKVAKGKVEKESSSVSLAEFLSIGQIPWIPTGSKRSFWMTWSESPAPGSEHCPTHFQCTLFSREGLHAYFSRPSGNCPKAARELGGPSSMYDSAFPGSAEEQGSPGSHFCHVSCFLKSFSIKPYLLPEFPSPLFPGCVGLPHPEEIPGL